MTRLLCFLALATSMAHAAPNLGQRMNDARSLPAAEHAKAMQAFVPEVAALPAADRLGGALTLAHLATEGDPGRETLQAITDLLAHEVQASPSATESKDAYESLAMLTRYEGVRVPAAVKANATFMAATDRLVADDRVAETADFALADRDGKVVTKKSLRGKVVLLNFWATWCPPCRAEIPGLEAVAAKHGDELVVLAVTNENADKVTAFLAGKASHLRVMLDAKQTVSDAFHVRGIPHTFAFDRQGKLAAVAVDGRSQAQFEAMVKKAGL